MNAMESQLRPVARQRTLLPEYAAMMAEGPSMDIQAALARTPKFKPELRSRTSRSGVTYWAPDRSFTHSKHYLVHLGDSLTIICSSILHQLIDASFGVQVKPTTDYSDASGVFRNLPVRWKSICRSCCARPKAAGRNGAYTQSINERGYFNAKTPRREVRKVLQINDFLAFLCVLAPLC